jgi:hypothetical protein
VKQNDTLAWLNKAVQETTKAYSVFQTSGDLPGIDPGIVVEKIGKLTFPLTPATFKSLKAMGKVAPYGKGTQTLTDLKVRNTIELDPSLQAQRKMEPDNCRFDGPDCHQTGPE